MSIRNSRVFPPACPALLILIQIATFQAKATTHKKDHLNLFVSWKSAIQNKKTKITEIRKSLMLEVPPSKKHMGKAGSDDLGSKTLHLHIRHPTAETATEVQPLSKRSILPRRESSDSTNGCIMHRISGAAHIRFVNRSILRFFRETPSNQAFQSQLRPLSYQLQRLHSQRPSRSLDYQR